MKVAELKNWMKENDKNEVDIASTLKIHPITVSRFLKGKSVHRSTIAAFQRLIASTQQQIHGGNQATS